MRTLPEILLVDQPEFLFEISNLRTQIETRGYFLPSRHFVEQKTTSDLEVSAREAGIQVPHVWQRTSFSAPA